MIRQALEIFVHSVMERGEITPADMRELQRGVLPDGIESREEADVLIALDRALPVTPASWSAFATQAVVDYVVWASRPTGYVEGEAASWLLASLTAGRGPSPLAEAIAFEVVREAERAAPELVAFAMRSARGRFAEVGLPHAMAA